MKEQHIIVLNIYKRTQQLVFSLKCQKFLINLCYKMYQHDRKPISSIWRVCGTILSPNTHRAPTSEHKACVRCYKHSCVLRFQALILKHPPIQNPLSLFFFLLLYKCSTLTPEFLCSRRALVHQKTKLQEQHG